MAGAPAQRLNNIIGGIAVRMALPQDTTVTFAPYSLATRYTSLAPFFARTDC